MIFLLFCGGEREKERVVNWCCVLGGIGEFDNGDCCLSACHIGICLVFSTVILQRNPVLPSNVTIVHRGWCKTFLCLFYVCICGRARIRVWFARARSFLIFFGFFSLLHFFESCVLCSSSKWSGVVSRVFHSIVSITSHATLFASYDNFPRVYPLYWYRDMHVLLLLLLFGGVSTIAINKTLLLGIGGGCFVYFPASMTLLQWNSPALLEGRPR